MKKKLSQILSGALLVVLCTAFGGLHAEGSVWDSEKNDGPHLQNALPNIDSCLGLFVEGEFLYWTVNRSLLDYAAVRKYPVLFDQDFPIGMGTAKMHFLDYDWDGGFRVGGGVSFRDAGCYLKGVWTHFETDVHDTITAHEGESLKAILWAPDTCTYTVRNGGIALVDMDDAYQATASHSIKYNVGDVLLGTRLFFTENCVFQPYCGVRGMTLDQRLNVTYSGFEFAPLFPPGAFVLAENGVQVDIPLKAHVHNESDLWAVGFHFGCECYHHIGCGFSLFGKAAGSVLLGRTDSRMQQFLTSEVEEFFENGVYNGPIGITYDVSEKEYVTLPGFELAGGFSWERLFCDNMYLTLKVGYEIVEWCKVPHMRRFVDDANEGISYGATLANLSFHGVTFRGTLEF